ncbi:hypothetical protein BG005_006842 [Podila minutissima]|nr:hypothetical protein BG005_006842 [Podila minutissima]
MIRQPPSILLGLASFPPYGPGFNRMNHVPHGPSGASSIPIQPMTIAQETNFVPTTNVHPVVNVHPIDVNDYSFVMDPGNYGTNNSNNGNQVFYETLGGRI